MKPTTALNFEVIREANPLPAYCQLHGIELRRAGSVLQGKCPVHQESSGASFTVWPEENRWRCFGKCSRGGDVVDLHAALTGLSLGEAARQLADGVPQAFIATAQPIRSVFRPSPPAYVLTEVDCERAKAASFRLAHDAALCERIAGPRGWKPETVRLAAVQAVLGWEDGHLVYCYSHGLKFRKGQGADRKIFWSKSGMGAGGECWRQWMLCSFHRRVIITEGESDTLTLMDIGLEDDCETLVVGLAGATIMPNPEPFAGKAVIIFPDRDAAGAGAAERLAACVFPFAASVQIADWSAIDGKEVA